MPINEKNQRNFHRRLYAGAGMLQTVTLYKRGDDQRQGTITTFTLFRVRFSRITKAGETYQGDMISNHFRTIHIPKSELDRIGIKYLNPADRFKDRDGRFWQPESMQLITSKLIETHFCCDLRRADNPLPAGS